MLGTAHTETRDDSQTAWTETRGQAIFLTNDKAYWEEPSKPPTSKDRNFRLHQGARLEGVLDWATPIASVKRRTRITLTGSYTAQWTVYSTQPIPPFRALTFDVQGSSRET